VATTRQHDTGARDLSQRLVCNGVSYSSTLRFGPNQRLYVVRVGREFLGIIFPGSGNFGDRFTRDCITNGATLGFGTDQFLEPISYVLKYWRKEGKEEICNVTNVESMTNLPIQIFS
jgi:hypothetical protein